MNEGSRRQGLVGTRLKTEENETKKTGAYKADTTWERMAIGCVVYTSYICPCSCTDMAHFVCTKIEVCGERVWPRGGCKSDQDEMRPHKVEKKELWLKYS